MFPYRNHQPELPGSPGRFLPRASDPPPCGRCSWAAWNCAAPWAIGAAPSAMEKWGKQMGNMGKMNENDSFHHAI